MEYRKDIFEKKDMVHLIFAEEGGRYFSPSLVSRDRDHYLYYQLRRKGCEHILFVRRAGDKFSLKAWDQESANVIPAPTQTFLQRYLGPVETTKPMERSYNTVSECAGDIAEILRKEQNAAVVSDLGVFSQLDKERRQFASELTRALDPRDNRGNLLVLVSTMNIENSFPILTDPKGPFRKNETGSSLCPEPQTVLEELALAPFYGRLQLALGGRMQVLNYIEKEELGYILDSVLLDHPEWSCTEEELKQIRRYLFRWLHSDVVWRGARKLMEEKCRYEPLCLEQGLRDVRVWEWLRQNAEEQCKKYPEYNCERDMKLCMREYGQQFDGVRVNRDGIQEGTKRQFYALREFYSTAYNRPRPESVNEFIASFTTTLSNAAYAGNVTLFTDCVDLVYDCGRCYYNDEGQNKQYFGLLKDLVSYKTQLDDTRSRNQRDQKELMELREQCSLEWSKIKGLVDDPELKKDEATYMAECSPWQQCAFKCKQKDSTLCISQEYEASLSFIVLSVEGKLRNSKVRAGLPELNIEAISKEFEKQQEKLANEIDKINEAEQTEKTPDSAGIVQLEQEIERQKEEERKARGETEKKEEPVPVREEIELFHSEAEKNAVRRKMQGQYR